MKYENVSTRPIDDFAYVLIKDNSIREENTSLYKK